MNHYELVSTSGSNALPWWNPRWAKREVLTITNQLTATLPASYTVRFALAGPSANYIYTQSLTSGNDLRLLYWDGKAYKELDRDLVAFGASAIELRLRTPVAILASGEDAGYYLYYANPTAGAPPREGKKVYAYFTDFNVSSTDWAATSGVWGQAVTGGHEGNLTWAYRQSDASNGSAGAYQKSLSLADLVYEVKVKMATAPSGSHASVATWRYTDTTHFYGFDFGSNGFTGLWKYNGAWSWLDQTPPYTYTANTWYTFTVTALGASQTVKVGSNEWAASDGGLSAGTIGLRTYLADVYYDDVKVRRLVSPEPAVTPGSEEGRSTGGEAVKYYYAGSKRIAMRRIPAGSGNGTLYYMFSDHLGSTSVTLNASTGATSTIQFFPFGGTRAGSVPTDHRFTGQKADDSTGLYFYGARFYDSSLGRFISPDSMVPKPEYPQDLNRYAYTRNNPLAYVDPSGHGPEDVAGAIDDFLQGVSDAAVDAMTVDITLIIREVSGADTPDSAAYYAGRATVDTIALVAGAVVVGGSLGGGGVAIVGTGGVAALAAPVVAPVVIYAGGVGAIGAANLGTDLNRFMAKRGEGRPSYVTKGDAQREIKKWKVDENLAASDAKHMDGIMLEKEGKQLSKNPRGHEIEVRNARNGLIAARNNIIRALRSPKWNEEAVQYLQEQERLINERLDLIDQVLP